MFRSSPLRDASPFPSSPPLVEEDASAFRSSPRRDASPFRSSPPLVEEDASVFCSSPRRVEVDASAFPISPACASEDAAAPRYKENAEATGDDSEPRKRGMFSQRTGEKPPLMKLTPPFPPRLSTFGYLV